MSGEWSTFIQPARDAQREIAKVRIEAGVAPGEPFLGLHLPEQWQDPFESPESPNPQEQQ